MKFYEDLEQAMSNLTNGGAFLTVKNQDGIVNTMTISWGYIGLSWAKPCFVTMVRPQRYTHDLLDGADSYTISIPYGGKMQKALGICGSKSGRDVDKQIEAGIRFVPSRTVAAPVVDGCDIYYECRLIYRDRLKVDRLPAELAEKCYQDDYHDLYYGEIAAVYKK